MKQESRTNINRVKKDISSPDSFTPPEELKRQLITTMQSIYDEEDIEAVERAYKVAYKAHERTETKVWRAIYHSSYLCCDHIGRIRT